MRKNKMCNYVKSCANKPKHYYLEENLVVIKALNQYRKSQIVYKRGE